jgi:hypothetical protein
MILGLFQVTNSEDIWPNDNMGHNGTRAIVPHLAMYHCAPYIYRTPHGITKYTYYLDL